MTRRARQSNRNGCANIHAMYALQRVTDTMYNEDRSATDCHEISRIRIGFRRRENRSRSRASRRRGGAVRRTWSCLFDLSARLHWQLRLHAWVDKVRWAARQVASVTHRTLVVLVRECARRRSHSATPSRGNRTPSSSDAAREIEPRHTDKRKKSSTYQRSASLSVAWKQAST
jgi:hypothetical protein